MNRPGEAFDERHPVRAPPSLPSSIQPPSPEI
jgi:hypothetical protein